MQTFSWTPCKVEAQNLATPRGGAVGHLRSARSLPRSTQIRRIHSHLSGQMGSQEANQYGVSKSTPLDTYWTPATGLILKSLI